MGGVEDNDGGSARDEGGDAELEAGELLFEQEGRWERGEMRRDER